MGGNVSKFDNRQDSAVQVRKKKENRISLNVPFAKNIQTIHDEESVSSEHSNAVEFESLIQPPVIEVDRTSSGKQEESNNEQSEAKANIAPHLASCLKVIAP